MFSVEIGFSQMKMLLVGFLKSSKENMMYLGLLGLKFLNKLDIYGLNRSR